MNHNIHHQHGMGNLYGQQQMGGYGGGFDQGMGAPFEMGFGGQMGGQMGGLGGPQQYGGIGQQLPHQPFGGQGGYGAAPGADAAVQFPPGAFSVVPPGSNDASALGMDANGGHQNQGYPSYL